MNIAYRTYLSLPDNRRISPISTNSFMSVLKKEQAISRYQNQTIQFIEAQVLSDKNENETLRSIKIWDVTLDAQGFVENKQVNHLSTADISSIEQEIKLKDSDQLVQSYIDVLLGETDSDSVPETSETITSRIWTIYNALYEHKQAA